MVMNYDETIQWLYSQLPMFQRIGQAAYKADLSNTIALLALLGNPQEHFKVIHVAGTNGKGSVSHMIASVLQQAGYKTGLYTSPHLRDFRERIRINGEMISREKVISFVESHRKEFEAIAPSFFEMTVGMAYDYFAREKVDFAVLETGMGGRLDSTNISHPVISIITHIDYDHTQFLGNSLQEIAVEKAGIIKEGIPVVIGLRQSETTAVYEQAARAKDTHLIFAEDYFELKPISSRNPLEKHYDVWHENKLYIEDFNSPLLGNYQTENMATALQAIETLHQNKVIQVNSETLRQGLENTIHNTHLMGRWQILGTHPLIIADTGHNRDGIMAIRQQLFDTDFEQLHFVLGTVSDKNHEEILSLLPKKATYYFCKADIPRGLDAEILKEKAFKAGLNGKSYPSVTHAFRSAVNNAGPNDLVFIGGSTYVVAEII
jgi:dihydrofolate synthase/folylpolyglutamate synthase